LMKAAPSAALTLTFYERLIKLASASWWSMKIILVKAHKFSSVLNFLWN
jgi:hypothetical protein